MFLNKKLIALLVLIISVFPVFTFAQNAPAPALKDAEKVFNYTLSNERAFSGTYAEYVLAEYLLGISGSMQSIIDKSWNTVSKKNSKNFANTKKILDTAKFEGDAGYNSKTKEFYIKNNPKFIKNRIVFEVNNKNVKSSFAKLDKEFAKVFEKNYTKEDKKKKKDLEKKLSKFLGTKFSLNDLEDSDEQSPFLPGSDIDYLMKVFEQLVDDNDNDYENGFDEMKIAMTGYSNTVSYMKVYVSDQSGSSGQPTHPVFYVDVSNGDIGPLDTERSIPGFDVNLNSLSNYDKYFINIEFANPQSDSANSYVNFKIDDIRQFGTLKPFDIWMRDFNYDEWYIESRMREHGVDYYKNK